MVNRPEFPDYKFLLILSQRVYQNTIFNECHLECGEGWPRCGVDEAVPPAASDEPRLGDLLDGDVGVEGDAGPVLRRRRYTPVRQVLLRTQRVGPLHFG